MVATPAPVIRIERSSPSRRLELHEDRRVLWMGGVFAAITGTWFVGSVASVALLWLTG